MAQTKLALRVELPEEVIARYDDHTPSGMSIEDIMAKRLASCVDHNATRGLYFNDEQRSELEKILGGHVLNSADAAIQRGRALSTVKVGGVDIQLDQTLLKRAESRALGMRMSIEEWLAKEITVGLETAVGLR